MPPREVVPGATTRTRGVRTPDGGTVLSPGATTVSAVAFIRLRDGQGLFGMLHVWHIQGPDLPAGCIVGNHSLQNSQGVLGRAFIQGDPQLRQFELQFSYFFY